VVLYLLEPSFIGHSRVDVYPYPPYVPRVSPLYCGISPPLGRRCLPIRFSLSPPISFIPSAWTVPVFKYRSVSRCSFNVASLRALQCSYASGGEAVGFIRPTFQHAATVYSGNFCHRRARLSTPMAARPIFRPCPTLAQFRRSIMSVSPGFVFCSTLEILFIIFAYRLHRHATGRCIQEKD